MMFPNQKATLSVVTPLIQYTLASLASSIFLFKSAMGSTGAVDVADMRDGTSSMISKPPADFVRGSLPAIYFFFSPAALLFLFFLADFDSKRIVPLEGKIDR